MKLTPPRAGVMVAAALVAAVALAGCTTTPHSSPTSHPAHTADGAASGVPTKVANDVTARKNVSITDCKAAPGGWAATGTAINNGTSPANYTITVFFTTPKGTVLGSAQTSTTIKPGHKTSWTATSKFPTQPGVLCALRGVG